MKKKQGWYERRVAVSTPQGIKNKAPEHYGASVKGGLKQILRAPIKKQRALTGYWTEEIILQELKKTIAEIGHFPTQKELQKMGRSDLSVAISRHIGGVNYFKKKLGYEILKVNIGYWTEETITIELGKIIAEIKHFPTHSELILIGKSGLSAAISKHPDGINYFRTKLGFTISKVSDGYWTEEKTLEELKKIIVEIGHFPTHTELITMERGDLIHAIHEFGSINYFRTKLRYDILKIDSGYWTEEKTLEELKKIIVEIGHFPTHTELITMGRSDLIHAITTNRGINHFRTKIGHNIIKVNNGYWTEEIILQELKKIVTELGHFPTQQELINLNRSNLVHAISRHGGGTDYLRKKLGYPPSLGEFMGSGAYASRRGYKSEKELKKILVQYCNQTGISEPKYHTKLSIGNIIEFVCGGRIGIDIINTKDHSGKSIRRKYREKDYHKYLDRLWIVVLSNTFTDEDYIRFNLESPKNVEIMSVWDLIDRLQVDIDEHSRRKLEALETCTLRTKDNLINDLKNRTLGEYT